MNISNIDKKYAKICNLITNRQISDAILKLEKLVDYSNNNEFKQTIEKQKQTYSFLLEYTFKGVEDPERANIYKLIQLELLKLTDKTVQYIQHKESSKSIFTEKRILDKEIVREGYSIKSIIQDLIKIKESENSERKQILSKLFFLIWLSENFTDEDVNVLKKYTLSKKLFMHEKSLIVSAITISLLFNFDEKKMLSLFYFYDADEQFVWNRALVGITIISYIFDKRISLYPKIINRIKLISDDDGIEKHIENIILQFIKTKETKKITKKLKDEIIPEMAKFQPKIEEKLDLDKILSDSLIEDQNPDWEEIFEDSPGLIDKMTEISEMQLDGSDVFMSAFAMLKHFPFFRNSSNWFLPFYKENIEIINSLGQEDEKFDPKVFTAGLERSAFICNSDKYSFCLNINLMPKAQKSMIIDLFKMEIEQMNEISGEDEILNKGMKNKHIFTRYIQDLYRFFKLHPWHKEFIDIFETELKIHNSIFFKTIISNENVLFRVAEFNFKNNYFEEAIEIYKQLDVNNFDAQKIYEKIGFSYQKLQNFEKALEYYQKAELYKADSLWLIKKIAFTYRKLFNYTESLKYYKLAEKKDPENLHIQANIGHILLYSENFEEAIKYYHKVEYFEPDNYRVMRPLAWCSLVLGKFENAKKYYQKLIDKAPNIYDYINFAHVLFCDGNKQDAIKKYKRAVRKSDEKTVIQGIKEDEKMLSKHNVSKTDIDLLIDFLKLKK